MCIGALGNRHAPSLCLHRLKFARDLISDISAATADADGNRTHPKRKRHHKKAHAECRHQYIQSCTWPQCNNSCPKLQNPVTGNVPKSLNHVRPISLHKICKMTASKAKIWYFIHKRSIAFALLNC